MKKKKKSVKSPPHSLPLLSCQLPGICNSDLGPAFIMIHSWPWPGKSFSGCSHRACAVFKRHTEQPELQRGWDKLRNQQLSGWRWRPRPSTWRSLQWSCVCCSQPPSAASRCWLSQVSSSLCEENWSLPSLLDQQESSETCCKLPHFKDGKTGFMSGQEEPQPHNQSKKQNWKPRPLSWSPVLSWHECWEQCCIHPGSGCPCMFEDGGTWENDLSY